MDEEEEWMKKGNGRRRGMDEGEEWMKKEDG